MKPILVISMLTLFASVAALAPLLSLSQLAPEDRLHVSYHSRGCFHDRKYEIDFQRGASVTARTSGRTVKLSSQEITGLDKLLEFYRFRPPGGCTTEDRITISYFRAGKKISSERYVDRSCATYEMKGVTRFYEVAKKLGLEQDR